MIPIQIILNKFYFESSPSEPYTVKITFDESTEKPASLDIQHLEPISLEGPAVEPVDTDNPVNPPENSENQLDN